MHTETFVVLDPDEVHKAYEGLVRREAEKLVSTRDPCACLLSFASDKFLLEVVQFFNSAFGVNRSLRDWNDELRAYFRFSKGFDLFTLSICLPYDILRHALRELCGGVEIKVSEALELSDFTETYLRLLIEIASPFCDADEVKAYVERLKESRRLINRILKRRK